MKIFNKDLDQEIAIIAEIGVNHEGSPDKAMELVRLAAEAGADAVKFQSYSANRYISSTDEERFARVQRFALSEQTHRELAKEADKQGIYFFSTAVSEDWVPLLAELGSVIKIASGDLTFEPVIRAAAATGKPVILSTGLGTVEEIDQSVGWFKNEIGDQELATRLILMQCTVAYPTPTTDANVLGIEFLRDRYECTVGFSNHIVGPEACYAAVARGATLLEIHFTDRKTGRDFRDHELSMEPADLADLVQKAPRIRESLGSGIKQRQPSELENIVAARKGIVAARPLPADHTLAEDDLRFARPAIEFSSTELKDVVGKRLMAPVAEGHPIPRNQVAG